MDLLKVWNEIKMTQTNKYSTNTAQAKANLRVNMEKVLRW